MTSLKNRDLISPDLWLVEKGNHESRVWEARQNSAISKNMVDNSLFSS